MSYDLAVWEGQRPADDEAAGEMFASLYERYVESDDPPPPSDRIRAYALALLDRYPDIGDEAAADSPWSTAPPINEAVGPLMYFPMVRRRCQEVSAWAQSDQAEDLSDDHGSQGVHHHGLILPARHYCWSRPRR